MYSKLPKAEQLLAVATYSDGYTGVPERKGAALAAGWSLGSLNRAWTGEVAFGGVSFYAVIVYLGSGFVSWDHVTGGYPVAVCLP